MSFSRPFQWYHSHEDPIWTTVPLNLQSCIHWPRPATSPPIWARIRGRYWSAKIDDISLWPLIFAPKFMQSVFILWISVLGAGGLPFFRPFFLQFLHFYPDLSFLYFRVCLATKIYNNLADTLESKHFKTHVKGHNSNRKENVYDRTIPSQFYFQVSSFMDT